MIKKILERHRVYDSYLFHLDKLKVLTSTGHEIERDLIVHPGAALILPVLDDGSIVMIRNYRYAAGDFLWELPCGTIDNNEDPLECARRELTEETGYTAENFEPLGSHFSCPGYDTETIYSFLATGLTPGRQDLEEFENIEVHVLPDEKVRKMVADNELRDSKSIAALSVYWMRKVVGS